MRFFLPILHVVFGNGQLLAVIFRVFEGPGVHEWSLETNAPKTKDNPLVFFCNEPTAGLDPQERIRFRELIAGLGRDRIILLSTHIVSDLEHIADRLMIMKEGRLIWRGKWDAGKENLEEFYISAIKGEQVC